MLSNQVVKVRRDEIAACMTCPICNKLLRDATTISECLHTFCRKCIRKKLTQDELECCPTCNIDLGCVPLEKLRPDHNMQDVRAKIFPYKRRRVKAPEVVPSLPLRRKERSLSSLVVSTPRVSPQTTMTGKRSKVTPRKKPRGFNFSIEKSVKKEEEDSMEEDCQESSSSHETSNKTNHISKQNGSSAEKEWEGKVDWKPLNDLVEAANRSKSSKLTSAVKSEPSFAMKSEGHVRKPKGKDQLQLQLQTPKIQDDKEIVRHEDDDDDGVKPKKLRRNRKKKCGGEQAMVEVGREKISYPIWFQLVPFQQQEGEPLRQIEGRYVKLNDGNVPVSIIQKLVMNKLKLPSEHEVELRCMGEPVVPTVQLCKLMEVWAKAHPDIITAKIGSSAHHFLMEISYAKKPHHPPLPAPQTP